MAIDFFDDFETVWATNGQIVPLNSADYQEGWAFIGDVPPEVEQFNRLQQIVDQRTAWLFKQMKELARAFGYSIDGNSVDALTQAFSRLPPGVPTGVILPFPGSVVPDDYALVNGAAVPRVSQVFGPLYEVIGTIYGAPDANSFYLPDTRGVLLRGLDHGRGLDPGRTLGSYQADSVVSHIHGVNDPLHAHGVYDPLHSHGVNDPPHQHVAPWGESGWPPPWGTYGAGLPGSGKTDFDNMWGMTSPSATGIWLSAAATGIGIYGSATGISIQATGGPETRGKNIAVNFIIKL
jgi:hypothetical protein